MSERGTDDGMRLRNPDGPEAADEITALREKNAQLDEHANEGWSHAHKWMAEAEALRDRVAALEGAARAVCEGQATPASVNNLRSILSRAQQGNEFSLSRQQERMDDVARQGGEMSDPVYTQDDIVIHTDQGRGVVTGEPSDTGLIWCDFEGRGMFGADTRKLRHAGPLSRWPAPSHSGER